VPVRRGITGVFVLAAVVLAGSASLAVPEAAAAAPPIQAKGTVDGALNTKTTIQVRLTVSDVQGWQNVDTINLILELRHRPLDHLQISPSASTLEILGFGPPARLGQAGLMLGAYFKIEPSKVTTSARGTTFALSMPMHLLANPPPGARLTLTARDLLGNSTGLQTLTPPVKSSSGFSIGVLLAAIALALFVGGFAGNVVSTRRRPPARPSIYGAVQRRMDQEKSSA